MLREIFRKKQGQSVIEYTVIFIVIMAVFLTTQILVRRGVMGRWRSAMDEHGDQYDPQTGNTLLRQTLVTDSQTQLLFINAGFTNGGAMTRYDQSTTTEAKRGYEGPATY